MNQKVGMLLQKSTDTRGVGISSMMTFNPGLNQVNELNGAGRLAWLRMWRMRGTIGRHRYNYTCMRGTGISRRMRMEGEYCLGS